MQRTQSIDFLRALAIVLVLGRHMNPCPAETSLFFNRFTNAWHTGGWAGVDLFFVLSGFLVSGLLFKEHSRWGAISLRHFFWRRGFKIYPAFWVLVLTTITLRLWTGRQVTAMEVISELLFIQNYGTPLWEQNWSLAVEEHFYLFLALLLYGYSVRQNGPRRFSSLPILVLFVGVTCLTGRILTNWVWAFESKTHVFASHLRMDSLFFGVLISYFYHHHNEALMKFANRYRTPMVGVGLLLFAPPFLIPLEHSSLIRTFGFTTLFLGSGCLLLGALTASIFSNRPARFLGFIGAHSYSIYIWHLFFAKTVIPFANRILGNHWNWFAYFVTYLVGTILFGTCMAYLVEVPVLKLRDRFFPSRIRNQVTNAPSANTLFGNAETARAA